MTTVIGLFQNDESAQNSIHRLKDAGGFSNQVTNFR
jgi:hypothetical protein